MSQYGKPKELNTKPLIVCALEVETQGQLDDYDVLYTGVGKVNATYALTSHFGKYGSHIPYDLVINYGTAGSRKIKKKTLVDCTKFVQRDMNITQLGFMELQTPYESPNTIVVMSDSKFNPLNKWIVCGTGDSFVDDIKKESLYVQVFDMEAYALAKVCRNLGVPFISFKYITDNVNEHSAKAWEENCSDGVQLFKSKVLEKLLDFDEDL